MRKKRKGIKKYHPESEKQPSLEFVQTDGAKQSKLFNKLNQWPLKKWLLSLGIFVLVFYLLYLIQWVGYPSFQAPGIQTPEYCLPWLEEGKLYGGQPYCFQGPAIYISAYLLSLIFFDLERGLLFAYFAGLFFITYFLYQIKVQETKEASLLSFSFFCLLSLFLFGKQFIVDYASLPAVLFLILGFYFLFYGTSQRKELIAGTFLALSLFSKPHNTPLVIGPIFLFYFLSEWRKFQEEKEMPFHFSSLVAFFREQWKKFFFLSMPFFLFFFLLLLFLPGFLFYNYIIHMYNPTVQSLFSIAKELATFTYYYNGYFLLFYIGIFVAFMRYIFYKKFDVFSFVSSISFLTLVIVVGLKFSLYKLIDQYRYFLPLVPFFILNISLLGKELREDYNKKAAGFLLVAVIVLCSIFYFVLGGLTLADFIENRGINDQKLLDRIKLDIEKPLLSLPEPTGKIFILDDYSYYHRYDLLFDKNPYLFVTEEDFVYFYGNTSNWSMNPDMAVAKNFVDRGILPSLEPYFHSIKINYEPHATQLMTGGYDIVIFTPFDQNAGAFLSQLYGNSVPSGFCTIAFPYFTEGTNDLGFMFRYLFFLDQEKCSAFAGQMIIYYQNSFDALCARGKGFITLLENAQLIFEKECTSNKQLLLVNNGYKFQALFFCVLITAYLFYILIRDLRIKRRGFSIIFHRKKINDKENEATQ